jgi:hypothetical protein
MATSESAVTNVAEIRLTDFAPTHRIGWHPPWMAAAITVPTRRSANARSSTGGPGFRAGCAFGEVAELKACWLRSGLCPHIYELRLSPLSTTADA